MALPDTFVSEGVPRQASIITALPAHRTDPAISMTELSKDIIWKPYRDHGNICDHHQCDQE